MNNTIDTAVGFLAGYMDDLKEGFTQAVASLECLDDTVTLYEENQALDEAYYAWKSSGSSANVESEGNNSYTWGYSADLRKAWMEECEKVEGMTFTVTPDSNHNCSWGAFGGGDVVTVATSNNGLCLAGSDNCAAIAGNSTTIADGEMFGHITNNTGIYCVGFFDKASASTKFLGSLVAATAIVAFAVLN